MYYGYTNNAPSLHWCNKLYIRCILHQNKETTYNAPNIMRAYGYLRASTKDQDAESAKNELTCFADKKGRRTDGSFS